MVCGETSSRAGQPGRWVAGGVAERHAREPGDACSAQKPSHLTRGIAHEIKSRIRLTIAPRLHHSTCKA